MSSITKTRFKSISKPRSKSLSRRYKSVSMSRKRNFTSMVKQNAAVSMGYALGVLPQFFVGIIFFVLGIYLIKLELARNYKILEEEAKKNKNNNNDTKNLDISKFSFGYKFYIGLICILISCVLTFGLIGNFFGGFNIDLGGNEE
jgi:uncharacterized membrane protein